MAQGDVKSAISTIAGSGILTVRPAVGEEWVIHNIYYTRQVQLRLTDGATFLQFDSDNTQGARLGTCFHLTNTQYLQILNTDPTNANIIAYDGMQTK